MQKHTNGIEKLENFSKKCTNLGKKLTRAITVPVIMFFLGLFTLPLGIIFWVIGLFYFIGALVPKTNDKVR